MRFDPSSLFVVVMAVAAALGGAWSLSHLDAGGAARAETVAVAVAVDPPSPLAGAAPSGPPAARLKKGGDGHYWAVARIDGRPVRLMVDTGASVVALTRQDAARLGVAPLASAYDREITTASGVTLAAPVTLKRIAVDGVELRDVQAVVVGDGLPHSLLGMSFLGRLSGFEATPSALTLTR